MLAKTLVVFYVWSPDIFVLSFYQNLFSGIAYSIMSNKTLPYHTILHAAHGFIMYLALRCGTFVIHLGVVHMWYT